MDIMIVIPMLGISIFLAYKAGIYRGQAQGFKQCSDIHKAHEDAVKRRTKQTIKIPQR